MDLTIYSDMDWNDEAHRASFLMAHEMEHTLLATTALQQGLETQAYPIGDVGDPKDWLSDNADMHQQLAENAGLDPVSNLEDWDLNDPEQVSDFQFIHLADHVRLAAAYGVLTE